MPSDAINIGVKLVRLPGTSASFFQRICHTTVVQVDGGRALILKSAPRYLFYTIFFSTPHGVVGVPRKNLPSGSTARDMFGRKGFS